MATSFKWTASLSTAKEAEITQHVVSLGAKLQHGTSQNVCTALKTSWQELQSGNTALSRQWAQVALDHSWEQLNMGNWEDVGVVWREVHSTAALLKALGLVREGESRRAVEELDRGILLGAPILDSALQSFATSLTFSLHGSSTSSGSTDSTPLEECVGSDVMPRNEGAAEEGVISSLKGKKKITFRNYKHFKDIDESTRSKPQGDEKRPRVEIDVHDLASKTANVPLIDPEHRIPLVYLPSLESFHQSFMQSRTPVVISGAMDTWPAYSARKWSLEYLRQVAGPRTVPVELGSRYTDDDWSQKLMTLSDFIDHHILQEDKDSKRGYLAQHHLFKQIPELCEDIKVPDYCCLREADSGRETAAGESGCGDDSDVKINAWFGPAGTVSPLHFDPEHNLLAQVVGRKYVKLYSEDQSRFLYPHAGILTNTSQVEAEHPDLTAFPEFSQASSREYLLHPGQMLYIPPRCWHYVRSIDISFSVSFWWH